MTNLRCSKVGEIFNSKVHTRPCSCINFSKMHLHCHYESKVPRHPQYFSIHYLLKYATHYEILTF